MPPVDHRLAVARCQRDVRAIREVGQRRVHLAGDVLGDVTHLGIGFLPAAGWRKLMLLMSPLVPLAIRATNGGSWSRACSSRSSCRQ